MAVRTEQEGRDDEAKRAAAFAGASRGCLRGCGTIVAIGVVTALLAYVVLAIYLSIVYHRHPY